MGQLSIMFGNQKAFLTLISYILMVPFDCRLCLLIISFIFLFIWNSIFTFMFLKIHLKAIRIYHQSVQFSSVAQLCPTLCDPMNRCMPGLPVHHHLPEFTQTHIQYHKLSLYHSSSDV